MGGGDGQNFKTAHERNMKKNEPAKPKGGNNGQNSKMAHKNHTQKNKPANESSSKLVPTKKATTSSSKLVSTKKATTSSSKFVSTTTSSSKFVSTKKATTIQFTVCMQTNEAKYVEHVEAKHPMVNPPTSFRCLKKK